MTQTTNRLFDDFAKLMTDAAGAAQNARQEFETMARAQMERTIRELDLVHREDFEAVRDMAQKAREENEALKARVEKLEAALNMQGPGDLGTHGPGALGTGPAGTDAA